MRINELAYCAKCAKVTAGKVANKMAKAWPSESRFKSIGYAKVAKVAKVLRGGDYVQCELCRLAAEAMAVSRPTVQRAKPSS